MKVESVLAALALRIVEVGLRDPRPAPEPVEVSCHCDCDCESTLQLFLLYILGCSLALNLGQPCLRRPTVVQPDGSPSRYSRGVVVLPSRGPGA